MGEQFGLVFDMDGVLADTEALIARASIDMFKTLYGVELTPEDFRPYIGTGAVRYVVGPAEDAGITLRDVDEAVELRHNNFVALLEAGECKALPGAIELIKTVADTNGTWKLAIATSTPEKKALITLETIHAPLDRFAAFINGDLVTHKKPDPEIYLKAADALNLPPSHCVAVEDAVTGVASAKTAGMKCLAVTNSFSREELAQADIIVSSLEDVTVQMLRGMVE
ncbi:MAG: haloacid dehalogenase [Candidatus Hydrogenedentota bacterium]